MEMNEIYHFANMMRKLGFPAYAARRLDDMYKSPGEPYHLKCKSVGIAFPLDMSEIHLTLNFSPHRNGAGFSADSYTMAIDHQPSGKVRVHTFDISPNSLRTVDEAFALLDGRAVQKQGTDNNGKLTTHWEQFDFKDRDDRGQYKLIRYDAFDLDKAMARLPFISELGRHQIEELSQCLKTGELTPLVLKGGRSIYLQANPAGGDIRICTPEGKVLTHEDLKPKHSIYSVIRNRFKRKRGKGI
jgi:hypothetical protein